MQPLDISFLSFANFSAKSNPDIDLFTISYNSLPSSVRVTPLFSLLNSFKFNCSSKFAICVLTLATDKSNFSAASE